MGVWGLVGHSTPETKRSRLQWLQCAVVSVGCRSRKLAVLSYSACSALVSKQIDAALANGIAQPGSPKRAVRKKNDAQPHFRRSPPICPL